MHYLEKVIKLSFNLANKGKVRKDSYRFREGREGKERERIHNALISINSYMLLKSSLRRNLNDVEIQEHSALIALMDSFSFDRVKVMIDFEN